MKKEVDTIKRINAIFLIAVFLLISLGFPVCTFAEEGDYMSPLDVWCKEHPNTVYSEVDEDTEKSLHENGYVNEESRNKVVKLTDTSTDEVAYLIAEVTWEGDCPNYDYLYQETTEPPYNVGNYYAVVTSYTEFCGQPGNGDALEEFYRTLNDIKTEAEEYGLSEINAASKDFYLLKPRVFNYETINNNPAGTVTVEYFRYGKYYKQESSDMFLQEVCPGLYIKITLLGMAVSGIDSWDDTEIGRPSLDQIMEQYDRECAKLETLINECLYKDYFVNLKVLTDDGFLTGYIPETGNEANNGNEYNGNTDIEINTEAGEEGGIEIFEVIPGVVIGGGAIAIGKSLISKGKNKKTGNKNKKKEKKKEEKKEEEEEEEKQSTYRMVLYKDFGNYLMMGDSAKKVCARIEEVTPDGVVKERGDLTSEIDITGAENIKVESTGFDGKYKYAMVKVQSALKDTIPDKAVVRFFYQGAGGSFANNVSFNVYSPIIEFAADGLCFVANEKQSFEIPFDVLVPEGVEMPLSNLAFNVEVSETSDFEASVITSEYGLQVRVSDTSSDKGYPGYSQDYVATVNAMDSSGDVIAKGFFPIVRFYEGLRLDLSDIKCYLIDAGDNPKEKYTDDPNVKKGYAPTRVDICLYAYDRENKCMTNPVLQQSDIKFKFEDVKGSCNIFDQEDNRVTDFCKILDFQYKLLGVGFNNNTAVGMISPGKGLLMPPTRFKAKVTCEVTWKGMTYTDSKTVLCASQKRRTDNISEDMTTSEYIRASIKILDPDYDAKKTDKLELMKYKLMCNDYKLNQMVPLIKKIDVMLQGYDPAYGYYEPDFKRVSEAYLDWLNGKFAPSEVNKKVFDTGDENYWSDFSSYMFYNSTESGWGTAVRIGCGILTSGMSEWVFVPIEIYNKMEDLYVNQNKSVKETIYTGAVEVVACDILMGQTLGKVVPFVSKTLNKSEAWRYCATETKLYFSKANVRITCVDDMKEGAKKLLNKSKLYRDTAEELKNLYKKYNVNIEFGSGGISMKEREASRTLDEISTVAEKKAKSEIMDFRKNYDLNSTEKSMSEAYARSRQDGLVKIKNFRDALSEGGEKAGQAALEIGKQKTALRQADTMLTKTEKGQLYKYRKDYIDAGTDAIKEGLMRERGIPKDKLSIEFVSSKSEAELLAGAKVNSDFDINVYYKGNDGKKTLLDSRLYKEYFTEAYCRKAGIDASTRIEKAYVLKSHDITLMDKNCADYLGDEVSKITNKELRGMKFEKPDKMFSGYRNKMIDPHLDAVEAMNKADILEKAGYKDMADDLRMLASRFEGEGHRTIGKAYDVLIDGRLREAMAQGNAPAKAQIMNIKKKVSVIKQSENMLDPGEVDAFFRTKYNQSYEDVVDEINGFGKTVNDGLGDYSGNLWKSYSAGRVILKLTEVEDKIEKVE